MKTFFSMTLVVIATAVLFVRANRIEPAEVKQAVDTVIVYAADARAIIDQKCFGCHNPNAKNEKAKKKFMWDELPKEAKAKQLKVMNDMLEVLGEGKMPPAKFLEFKPEAKLTDAEVTTLTTWAEGNAKKLMK